MQVLYQVRNDSHCVPGKKRDINLGIISNFWSEVFITLRKHSHVMTVDECCQDECGPFSAQRKRALGEGCRLPPSGRSREE